MIEERMVALRPLIAADFPAVHSWAQLPEVCTRLLNLAFHTFGRHRVHATCDPRNLASARVLTKLGMTHEGRLRETLLLRDGWRDSDLYAILTHEWPS
ncbi:GNAT family protein [Actinoplanes sp. NPDC048796]|uniref:GNAT family N-acetyltransferase n=1 Tax=Actinoplanes sp. NPDC048796 TaxID=3155640 RepID=UPI0033FA0E9B